MKIQHRIAGGLLGLAIASMAGSAFADCYALPGWSALKGALVSAVAVNNGGLGFNQWGTIVANDGTVCAVAFSGQQYTAQWLGSRVISAQKANTANDFSLGLGTPATSAFPMACRSRLRTFIRQCSPAAASMASSTAIR
jgi:hypothetical protein